MGRHRSRSRSYSPRRSRSPPRRRRYDEPRETSRATASYRDRRSPASPGLLVRNIALDARPEDLRVPFERFGPVKDVYLPKNYYTGEPRGFGFVKFRNSEDAAEAKHHLNHSVIGGREIAIVYAEENRKNPQEMRRTGRVSSRSGGSYRRRSPIRSPRRRRSSYSPSPSPPRRHSRDKKRGARGRSRSPSPSPSRSISLSRSPREVRPRKSNHRSPSPNGSDLSPRVKGGQEPDKRSRSPKEIDEIAIASDKKGNGLARRSPSPRKNDRALSRSLSSRSRSLSPRPRSYSR